MVLQALGYPDVEPEDLRNLIHPGAHHSGGEDFGVVKAWLEGPDGRQRFPNLPTLSLSNPDDTIAALQATLEQGYPTIFDVWDDRNANILNYPLAGWRGTHAVLLLAQGKTKTTVWNPWNGEQAGQTFDKEYIRAATLGRFVGNLLVFQRSIVPAPPPPPPPVLPLIPPPVISGAPLPPPPPTSPSPESTPTPTSDPIISAPPPVAPTPSVIDQIVAFLRRLFHI